MSYELASAATPIVPPSGRGFIWVFLSRQAGQRLEDELADRGEVVAALLHDDGGEAKLADDAACVEVARGRDLERALRVAGCGVDAERDDEGLCRRRELGGPAD